MVYLTKLHYPIHANRLFAYLFLSSQIHQIAKGDKYLLQLDWCVSCLWKINIYTELSYNMSLVKFLCWLSLAVTQSSPFQSTELTTIAYFVPKALVKKGRHAVFVVRYEIGILAEIKTVCFSDCIRIAVFTIHFRIVSGYITPRACNLYSFPTKRNLEPELFNEVVTHWLIQSVHQEPFHVAPEPASLCVDRSPDTT